MREILFRGQRIDNGKWVYGMPLESKFGCTYMLTKQGGLNADFIYSKYTILDKKDSIPVVSESIGQFTGLLDKNENKIFEGDKVKLGDSVVFVVEFIDGAFAFKRSDTYVIPLNLPKRHEIEITGKIHEDGDK